MILNFGMYKGENISDVPGDYLDWMKKNLGRKWSVAAHIELQRRSKIGSPARPVRKPTKTIDLGKEYIPNSRIARLEQELTERLRLDDLRDDYEICLRGSIPDMAQASMRIEERTKKG